MALGYKLFKTLEIDGVKMGVDPTVGSVIVGTEGGVTIASSSVAYLLSEIDVEPNTLYWVGLSGTFGAATTTGVARRSLRFDLNDVSKGIATFLDGNQSQAFHQYSWVAQTPNSNTPLKFQFKVQCDKVQDVTGYIAVFKLLSYMGG